MCFRASSTGQGPSKRPRQHRDGAGAGRRGAEKATAAAAPPTVPHAPLHHLRVAVGACQQPRCILIQVSGLLQLSAQRSQAGRQAGRQAPVHQAAMGGRRGTGMERERQSLLARTCGTIEALFAPLRRALRGCRSHLSQSGLSAAAVAMPRRRRRRSMCLAAGAARRCSRAACKSRLPAAGSQALPLVEGSELEAAQLRNALISQLFVVRRLLKGPEIPAHN